MFPAFASGIALVNATVISDDQPQRDRGFWCFVFLLGFRRLWRKRAPVLDGERMHIRMQFLRKILAKSLATVVGSEERKAENKNTLVISWIDPNLTKIKRTGIDIAGSFPGLPAVLGAKNAAAFAVNVRKIVSPAFVAVTARPIFPVRVGKPLLHFFHVPPPFVLLKIPPTSSPLVAEMPYAKPHGV